MQQESISNHFKNVKRKSALEAKEKISSLNGTSSYKPGKLADDTEKPIKIIPESQNNLSRTTIENAALPLKRRSARNNNNNKDKGEESDFEVPKTLERNKKINLEENIKKKRNREEESIKSIKAAKAQLMQKSAKIPKKNGKNQFNESLVNDDSMDIDDLPAKNQKQKEKKNVKKTKLNNSNDGSNRRLVNNDLSEKTKNIVKKVMEDKIKQMKNKEDELVVAEFSLNESNDNYNLNNNKARNACNINNKYRNISSDKNYISDDVLDTVEETLKNKKAQNYTLALRERRGKYSNKNNPKVADNKGNLNNSNNINNESSQKSPNCNSLLSTNSTDLNDAQQTSNIPNTNNESTNSKTNINNFESPSAYIFNKINDNFSFEQDAANEKKELTPTKSNNKNSKNNTKIGNEATQKSLLLSMEANKAQFKEPVLSQSTLKIMSELRDRKNNFKREEPKTKERDRSQSSFSLKFKYEELVKNERELLLPPSYKKLLVKFTQLDQTLNFFKISKSNKVPSFPEIKRSIEVTHKEDFEFEHFLKMLYIVPHFFVYSWEKLNNSEKDYSLLIGVPSKFEEKMNANYPSDFDFLQMQTKYEPSYEPLRKEVLEKRKMIFKNILLEIVNFHHKEFLKSQNFSRAFDPFKLKTWHSSFNLETDVTEIPIFEIAEKPIIKIVKMSEFINNNDFKSDLIERAIEECSKENAKEKEKSESEGNQSPPVNKDRDSILPSYISNRLLQKIKAKESAVKMHNEIIEYSTQKSKQKSRLLDLKDLIDRMKNIYIMQKYTSIPINELCEKIKSGSDSISCVDSIDMIKNIVIALKKHFPHLLVIKDTQHMGTIVRLNQEASIYEVFQEIQDKNLADEIYGL